MTKRQGVRCHRGYVPGVANRSPSSNSRPVRADVGKRRLCFRHTYSCRACRARGLPTGHPLIQSTALDGDQGVSRSDLCGCHARLLDAMSPRPGRRAGAVLRRSRRHRPRRTARARGHRRSRPEGRRSALRYRRADLRSRPGRRASRDPNGTCGRDPRGPVPPAAPSARELPRRSSSGHSPGSAPAGGRAVSRRAATAPLNRAAPH
jgi:hypothetical protein